MLNDRPAPVQRRGQRTREPGVRCGSVAPDGQAGAHETADAEEVRRCLSAAAHRAEELQAVLTQAAQVAGAPMATVNLLDEEQQHQAATCGFTGGSSPRSESMCALSMRIGGFVHVPDASLDERFAGSPWVDGRRADVRFYAAAPLISSSGAVLGTLCVFDVRPHQLDPAQVDRLEDLAARASDLLTAGPVTT